MVEVSTSNVLFTVKAESSNYLEKTHSKGLFRSERVCGRPSTAVKDR